MLAVLWRSERSGSLATFAPSSRGGRALARVRRESRAERRAASATRTSTWPPGSTSSPRSGSSARRAWGRRSADYFHYAERVDAAPEAAFIPINRTRAAKIEARLEALGVSYERRDLMKPVLLRLSRKVDPGRASRADVSASPDSTRR